MLFAISESASRMAFAQSIIPPADDAVGGGNPLQGLGRPDDPGPSRVEDYLNSLKSSILENGDSESKPLELPSDQQSGETAGLGNTTDSALPKTDNGQKSDALPLIPGDDDQPDNRSGSNLLPPPPPMKHQSKELQKDPILPTAGP